MTRGARKQLGVKKRNHLKREIEKAFAWAEVVLISDYDYGIITKRLVRWLKKLNWEKKLLVVDAKDVLKYHGLPLALIKPNYEQALTILQKEAKLTSVDRLEQIRRYGERILRKTGAQIAAVTLDKDGALIFERGDGVYRTYTDPVESHMAVGAGDTFAAAMGLSLAAGASMPLGAELAATAARVSVSKEGTSVCTSDDLANYHQMMRKHIINRKQLAQVMELHRTQGKRVVFTNGCFDLLHRGHVTYLNQAKALGDILVVAVNSDESVVRLKGETRPINQLEDRLEVLQGLSSVDHVISFDEDTPIELIKVVRPDIYVKGGDYEVSQLPEAYWVEIYGGTVKILPYLEDQSTTGIITKIQKTSALQRASGVL
jgi:D-beta-D-heptose 7-phosphate kinase / D-beta-D-heptose 1-phosphate adenosyltransferase